MRTKRIFSFSAFSAVFIASYVGVQPSAQAFSFSDEMAGCYARKIKGPATLKIEKEGGQYFVSMPHRGKWDRAEKPMAFLPPEEIQKLFKQDSDKVESMLSIPGGMVSIVRFKKGAVLKGKHPESDYFVRTLFSSGPAFPTDKSCDKPQDENIMGDPKRPLSPKGSSIGGL